VKQRPGRVARQLVSTGSLTPEPESLATKAIVPACPRGTDASVAVQRHVIGRIHAQKPKTVSVRAGTATRHRKAVKSAGPNDLVFQSVVLERNGIGQELQLVDFMVARDGIEPPTPAFSGL